MDVTVITPTIPGREDLLQECIESVQAQTSPVVTHLWKLDVAGAGPALIRNDLVMEAQTEWVAFLDDDDLLLPHHFATHEPFINDADIIFSWTYITQQDGWQDRFDSHLNVERILEGHNSIPVTSTVRRESFLAVGGFPDIRFEDLGLWQKFIRAGARFHGIEEVTWLYRINPIGRNSKE